ncbi:MAG: aminotransferase class V-fold PLP-dependent enzyme [Methylocystis sp.]
MRRIYLDYNASTPIDPAVVSEMAPFLDDHYGNPSSSNWAGATAKAAIETARGRIAALSWCCNFLEDTAGQSAQPGCGQGFLIGFKVAQGVETPCSTMACGAKFPPGKTEALGNNREGPGFGLSGRHGYFSPSVQLQKRARHGRHEVANKEEYNFFCRDGLSCPGTE